MKNDTTDLQDNYNSYMEKQVVKMFGSEVGPLFKAFQHPGGFKYMTNDGLSYNHLSVECLDSLLQNNKETGQLGLEEGGFSKLYYNILCSTRYTLSQASQRHVNDAMISYAAQASAVIQAYKNSGLPPLTATTQDAAIAEIYKNCATAFGGAVTKDCSIISNAYLTLKLAMQELNNIAGDAAQLVMDMGNKNGVLASIIANMKEPSDKNGGIPIDSGTASYYVGYKGILSSKALADSLNTTANALTIDVSGESYGSDSMNVHMDNKAVSVIPILGLIDIEAGQKSTFDMNKLKTSSMEFSAQITYSGITPVPVQPAPSEINGQKGWYDETSLLKEIKEKTNNDVDGYKLVDSRYDVNKLFGGDLARLKLLLISKTPSIAITLSNINMDYAKSVFSTEKNVTITLFGFIKLGQQNNKYETSSVQFNEESNSVTLTFSEPNVSGTPYNNELTAFIMGGVPDYPGMN